MVFLKTSKDWIPAANFDHGLFDTLPKAKVGWLCKIYNFLTLSGQHFLMQDTKCHFHMRVEIL